MVWRAVWLIRTSATRRVQRWLWPRLGWPEPTTAMASAAAGASGSSGARPQRTGGMVKGLAELLRMLGARCRARTRPKQAMAATAAWSAAASSGRRQSGSCGVQTRERRGGKQHRSSQRVQWWPRRARGGTGVDEFDEDGRRFRGRRRRRWQRCGTSGASWLVEEVEGGPAELPGASVRLGVDTGRGGARRCSRVLVVDRERERAEGDRDGGRDTGE